jgi:hypothetical protein
VQKSGHAAHRLVHLPTTHYGFVHRLILRTRNDEKTHLKSLRRRTIVSRRYKKLGKLIPLYEGRLAIPADCEDGHVPRRGRLTGLAVWWLFDDDAKPLTVQDAQDVLDAFRFKPLVNDTWGPEWTDLHTVSLCVSSVGADNLRCVRPDDEMPAADVVCDVTALQKYRTRPGWVGYGAKAFLKRAALPRGWILVGIYTSHHRTLFTWHDAQWRHATAIFRSAVLAEAQVLKHLHTSHLGWANSLVIASRACLPSDHPLRRSIRCFTEHAAYANIVASENLCNAHSLTYAVFGFSREALENIVVDHFDHLKFSTLPRRLSESNLPSDIRAISAAHADGVHAWHGLHGLVTGIVRSFSAEEVIADEDVTAFWRVLNESIPGGWSLPQLTNEALTDVLTEAFWWCSYGHEHFGSLAPFAITPSGVPLKLRDGAIECDANTYFLVLSIISSVSPTDNDSTVADLSYEELCLRPDGTWDAWQQHVRKHDACIRRRNIARVEMGLMPCHAFVSGCLSSPGL